jgi:hypothetical protein
MARVDLTDLTKRLLTGGVVNGDVCVDSTYSFSLMYSLTLKQTRNIAQTIPERHHPVVSERGAECETASLEGTGACRHQQVGLAQDHLHENKQNNEQRRHNRMLMCRTCDIFT